VKGVSTGSGTNIGVIGNASGSGSVVDGVGVYGTGSTMGVYGQSTTYGVFGNSSIGTAVYGMYGDGSNFGYLGSSTMGVYGQSTTYGVFGNSSIGTAVYGMYGDGSNFGYLGSANVGVYGQGTNYGIKAYSPSGFAGFFEGKVNVTGTLYASNVSSNSPLQLQTRGTTRMYINDSNGNVGIGTTAPSARLDVDLGTGMNVGGGAAIGGSGNIASADYSFAVGNNSRATGNYSVAMGYNANASNLSSFAMGTGVNSTGYFSFASGWLTQSTNWASTAMGEMTIASGPESTAMGASTKANNTAATAMGSHTLASGMYSTAAGYYSNASGFASFAAGDYANALGDYSVAMGGRRVVAAGDYTVAIGLADMAFTQVSQENTMAILGGRVGINTTAPDQQLKVNGSANITGTLYASNVSSNSPLQLQTQGTTRMYINDSNGNVGIGTSSPVSRVSIGANGISEAMLYVENSNSTNNYNTGIYGSASSALISNRAFYGFAPGADDFAGYFAGNGAFGGTLAVGGLTVGAQTLSVDGNASICSATCTGNVYATAAGELFVEGDIDVNGRVYAGSINATAYYAGTGTAGITQTITVRDGGGAADCTITISDGLITATTC
jgi:hypothetical protein